MFRLIFFLILSAPMAPALDGGSRLPASDGPNFEVRLKDYAGLSRGVRRVATGTASQVFQRAGVKIDWLDCTIANPKRDEQCRAELNPETRVIRILPPEMAAKMPASGIEFGRAQLTPDGSRGTFASVYWGRVQQLAAGAARSVSLRRDLTSTRFKESRILGYVLAHELGHLFGVHHGRAGVMHGPWSPSELAELLLGTLRFQKAEAQRIRLALTGLPD